MRQSRKISAKSQVAECLTWVVTPKQREENVVENGNERSSVAMWLAQGYLQGQRDLLTKLAENRFEAELTDEVRTAIAQIPASLLETVGPLVLTAPNLRGAMEAIETLSEAS